jgi:hypothetical protein
MLKINLDLYSRKARLYPALLTALPLLLAVLSFSRDLGTIGLPLSVVATCGFAMLLAQFGRDLGKRKEDSLFRAWGGTPTTQFLRHRSDHLSPVTRRRYHAALEALVPNVKLPSREEEAADPTAADQVYMACVDWLREATRDRSQFPLVFSENVNYGFRRNFWALRRIGISVSALAFFLSVAAFLLRNATGVPLALPLLSGSTSAAYLGIWLLHVDADWVKLAGFAYARALLATCDTLSKATGAK